MTRRIQQRSRAVLFWALGLFLAVQLVGGLLLDYAWPLLRFPSAAAMLANLRQTPRPRIVFLGSSRTRVGIDQAEVDLTLRRLGLADLCSTFNAAVPAGDPITEEHLLGRLLDEGVRPEWVVLEVSPETLNQHNEWLAGHVQRQLRWEHVPAYLAEACWSGQGMRFLCARFLPLYVHREEILRLAETARAPLVLAERLFREGEAPTGPALAGTTARQEPRPPSHVSQDEEPVDWRSLLRPPHCEVTPELRERIEYTAAYQLQRWLRHFRIAGNSPRALERTLRLCQQRRIRALLVAMPVTTAHRNACTDAIEQAFQDYLARLLRSYPCGFVDCRDWVADGLFLDNHHLQKEGQTYFSRLFAHRVLGHACQDQSAGEPEIRLAQDDQ